ncbi:MAG: DNA-directed RNA polymerase subunit K [Candidatus Thermoplasmatota archaeon]|nr:DNA-directed RNA polymerase subunit K [Candidatus Thermoplasmatota archaeon]
MNHTRYETARIVGARALQISMGAPSLLADQEVSEAIALAELEFERGILPITVERS